MKKQQLAAIICIPLCLIKIIACGGDTDKEPSPSPEPALPEPYAQKLTNINISDNLIFFAAEVDDDRFELFSIDPTTGSRNNISDIFSAKNSLQPISISEDGTKVAYRADKNNDGIDELYSNLVDGSTEVMLTDSLPTYDVNTQGLQVINWQWLPDSSRIIFRNDSDEDGILEIQSILPDGNDLQILSDELSTICDGQICWKISSDSAFILFKAQLSDQSPQNLHAVSTTAVGLTQLNQTLSTNSEIIQWEFSPDNSLVSYISHNAGEPRELYTILPDASQRTLLNGGSLSLGVMEFKWALKIPRIAFTEDYPNPGQPNLFTDIADATDRIQMIDTFKVAAPNIINWQWSPDSSHITYLADQETLGVFELFNVQNDGTWHRKLNETLPLDGVVHSQWQWSPNSDFIAYYSDLEIAVTYDELFVVSTDTSQRNQINSLHSNKLKITQNHWLEDGSRLIYTTVDTNGNILAIYSVLPDSSQVIQLTNETSDTEFINDNYSVSPDGTKILYQISASDGSNSKLQIGSIHTTNRTDLGVQGNIIDAYWLKDSSRIVYVYQTDANKSQQLYSILPDATGRVNLY